MKNKVIVLFITTILLLFIGITYVFSEVNAKFEKSSSSLGTEQTIDKSSDEHYTTITEQGQDKFTLVNFEEVDGEKIYRIFGGQNSDEIIEFLNLYPQDSDRVVVTTDGKIFGGKFDLMDKYPSNRTIDSETDSRGVTIKELKVLIENYKDDINELAIN